MKQRFFCENCNRPVDQEAEFCPHCGSSFRAVKCPRCGFVGKADMFAAGCPICGYLSGSKGVPGGFGKPVAATHGVARKAPAGEAPREKPARRPERRKLLPDWFYPVAGVVLLGIIVLLVILYTRL